MPDHARPRRSTRPHAHPLDVGMDGPPASSAVASVAPADGAAVVARGTVGTRPAALDTRIRPRQSTRQPRGVVDDAGPGGDGRSRDLPHHGHGCGGGAPAVSPQPAGDRVHTARRAALPWARLRRAGDRTPVSVPTVQDDARRALSRARDAPRPARQTAPCRLHACRRRPARRHPGRATGGPAHRRWRRAVGCPTPAPHRVGPAEVRAVTAPTPRRQRLDPARRAPGPAWRLCPVVDAWPALRGGPWTGAVTSVAARGDRPRVDHPRPRRHDRGRTPSASARGVRRRQGGLTTTGTTPARRALGAGAWAARAPATGSRPRPRRRATRPTPSQAVSGTAPVRRGPRSRQRTARGHTPPQVGVAMARARSAVLWAMAQPVPVPAARGRRSGPCRQRPHGGPGQGPKAMGRDAAPGWCHPRRRAAVTSRGPRPRPAPDGDPSGGRPPPAIRGRHRRHDWRRLLPWRRGKNACTRQQSSPSSGHRKSYQRRA
jgi:transposase